MLRLKVDSTFNFRAGNKRYNTKTGMVSESAVTELFSYQIVELADNENNFNPKPEGDHVDDYQYDDSVTYYAVD